MTPKLRAFLPTALAIATVILPLAARADEAIAMHGAPALAPGFTHFPYADPDAPKGGRLRLCLLGTFDSLNPYNLKAGSTAQGLGTMVFETLMARSQDEPFTLYGLIAKGMDTDPDRTFATFHLDPAARFSDGSPITSSDVRFTFDLLKSKGRPQQRAAFAQIKAVSTPDPETIRFDLQGSGDRELPLFLGLMPVLSSKTTDAAHFDETTLKPPVASGPYRVGAVDPGQKLVLERNPDYWGRDLPTRRGMFNFDRVDIDYYRDANALFEVFKAGQCDFRIETDPARWLTAYHFPGLTDGRDIKAVVPLRLPKGMDGFAFNTRRAIFADARVREALGDMFDFGWVNRNLYGRRPGHGQARRRGAVPAPPTELRFRHDAGLVVGVPLARCRAALALELRQRQAARLLQPARRRISGHRCCHFGHCGGPIGGGLHRRHAGPRPAAAVGILHHSALPHRRPVDRLFHGPGTAGRRSALRHHQRHADRALVAETGGMKVPSPACARRR